MWDAILITIGEIIVSGVVISVVAFILFVIYVIFGK